MAKLKIKKETLIIIFYILYFGWLFTVAFLTRELYILNYFTGFVAVFYFIFLRESGDFKWFSIGFILALFLGVFSFAGWQAKLNLDAIVSIPPWLPVAWGTTIVTLRKFYLTIS